MTHHGVTNSMINLDPFPGLYQTAGANLVANRYPNSDSLFDSRLQSTYHNSIESLQQLVDGLMDTVTSLEERLMLVESYFDDQETDITMSTKEVKVSEVLELLKQGYARYEKDNRGEGSIQAKFGLSYRDTAQIFEHPKLKGRKRKAPPVRVIDDTVPTARVAQMQPVQQESVAEVNPFS